MLAPSRRLDPSGYYARLGVDPAATQGAITHAFRRKALVLHPDVPKTGDKDAFVAIRAAYDVLSNTERRRAYDEASEAAARPAPPPPYNATHGAHDFRPQVADAPWLDDDAVDIGPGFTPKPAEAPPERERGPGAAVLIGGGVAIVLCVGVVQAVTHLRTPPPTRTAGITPNAPPVAPQTAAAQRAALYGPPPRQLTGVPNYYVVPAAVPTVLWRQDKDHDQLIPSGPLPSFSSVQALRLNRQTGLVEVRVDDTSTGFIEARSLAPGDVLAARRAYCSYNAGPVPYDGEVLIRATQGEARQGGGRLRIENRGVQPTVVKLRDPVGTVAMSVFLAPNGASDVTGVPAGPLRADFAIGELWSRACNTFAAGMRAYRMSASIASSRGGTLVLPPGEGASTEISDEAFEQD
jgi:DnaJ domain